MAKRKVNNEDRLDLAGWLIKEGYGTPYRVSVEGFSSSNDHFTIPCLGKSIMALRLTYYFNHVEFVSERDTALWGESYVNKVLGRKEKIYYLGQHKIDLEYLTENGWVRFVRFDTRVLKKETLAVMTHKEHCVSFQEQTLQAFEEKIRSLLDHMITFHGLTLV